MQIIFSVQTTIIYPLIQFYNYIISEIHPAILMHFPPPDFEGDEKPKRRPLEIEFFFVEGSTKGVEGGQEPSKTLFFINGKRNFQIWGRKMHKYPSSNIRCSHLSNTGVTHKNYLD